MRLPNPQTKTWHQSNREGPPRVENGRLIGTMRGSMGLDLQSVLGRVRLRGTILTTNTAGNANFTGYSPAFRYFQGKIWAIGGTKMHNNTGVPSAAFTVDTATATPTDLDSQFSDMEVFPTDPSHNIFLCVTNKGNTVYYTESGTLWSSFTVGSSDTANPHLLCYFAQRMYYTRIGNQILSFNSARTVATSGSTGTLNLSADEVITFIKAGSNRIWIGTINTNNRLAKIYEWDGASPQPTRGYEIEALGALSCVIKGDIPYVMDSQGRLLAFNNTTFVEVARLPIANRYLNDATYTGSNGIDRFIHPNGMTIHNNRINLLINNLIYENGSPVDEFTPAGVWEYDPDLGLYHRMPLSYTPTALTTTDYGQFRIGNVGAIQSMKILTNASGQVGNMFMSAGYYTDASTLSSGIWVNDTNNTKRNAGYLVTAEIDSDSVEDFWSKVFLEYARMLNATDKINLKYRITKATPTEMTITWTSTTTFTTTDVNMANYTIGDEVEILRGKGGGMCSHITVISLNAGTYTVTVDETHEGATSGTATARLQKWIKANGFIADQTTDYKQFGLGQYAGWIQFKIFFLWTGNNEFQYMDIVNTDIQKAV